MKKGKTNAFLHFPNNDTKNVSQSNWLNSVTLNYRPGDRKLMKYKETYMQALVLKNERIEL
jgi:hypothetical protein